MTDAAVAAKFGTSPFQVEAKRNHLEIPAYAVPVRLHIWLPEKDSLLGVKNDSELAALLDVPDLADDASSRLRLRLAVLKGLT